MRLRDFLPPFNVIQLLVSLIGGGLSGATVSLLYNPRVPQRILRTALVLDSTEQAV